MLGFASQIIVHELSTEETSPLMVSGRRVHFGFGAVASVPVERIEERVRRVECPGCHAPIESTSSMGARIALATHERVCLPLRVWLEYATKV